ncbi:uncharacterized protein [Dysidea avara]|uniref:uncharacterized protein isoform X2 n=1 Tax=Dysidea avara TaxID=196820 RepID=UPI00333415A3
MWCTVPSAQDSEGMCFSTSRSQKTMEALVNIPAVSERSLRYDFSMSDTTVDSRIQLTVLDEAAKCNVGAWWWLKADGCDIVKGLKESTKLQWSGDVDLADGALQKQYKAYQQRLDVTKAMGLKRESRVQDLTTALSSLSKDLEFVQSELIKSNNVYSEKTVSPRKNEKEMVILAWKIKELTELNETGRQLFSEIKLLKDKIQRDNLETEASHILVFMISTEDRRKKPYAIPVQCMPYQGLTDSKVRDLANSIISEMAKRKMNVAGFTTDGEWNSLRTKGNSRPLSVFQIRADARSKYSHMSVKRMVEMITPIDENGAITALLPNHAISPELLGDLNKWKSEGANLDDVIEWLRLQTVPPGYEIHTWTEGKDETKAEKLCSILAQLEYSYQVNLFDSKGTPFKSHLYVTEVHPITGVGFCEREDEAHIFKRIGHSLRQGNSNLQLERFAEALHDPSAGLTYCALSGIRKQSVEDVDRLFGQSLIDWMERKGYCDEVAYLQVIHNWRRACDERGLTNDQRSTFNKNLLSFILDDLMPWHRNDGCDFSFLEVNRKVNNIRGFSRETLIALVANIESREWRRNFNIINGIPPEHPRASTTDDVECFF